MIICLHPLNPALDPVNGPQQVLSKHGQVLTPTCLLPRQELGPENLPLLREEA